MRDLQRGWQTLDPSKVDSVQLVERDGTWAINLWHVTEPGSRSVLYIYEGEDEIDLRRKAHEIAERFGCDVFEGHFQ